MTTILLDTEDLGHAEAVVHAIWPHLTIVARQLNSGRMRIIRSSLGDLHVDEVDIDYDVGFVAEPTDSLQLVCVRAGTIEYNHWNGSADRFSAGWAGGFGGVDGLSVAGRMHKARFHLITMNRRALADVAVGESPVHLTALDPVSDIASRQLTRVTDYVCSTAIAEDSGGALVASAVERLLAATVLTALPTTATADVANESPRGGTPALLRRAIAFIDERAAHEVSLDDIAAAVYVTPRALQYMFRRHRDCTPMEYLRIVRLAHARGELIAGDRTTTSVSEVARRWSLGHLGRFASNYRQMYGESPHETLRG